MWFYALAYNRVIANLINIIFPTFFFDAKIYAEYYDDGKTLPIILK